MFSANCGQEGDHGKGSLPHKDGLWQLAGGEGVNGSVNGSVLDIDMLVNG